MNEKIKNIIQQADSLTLRERVILFGAVIATVVGSWNFLYFSRISAEQTKIKSEITAARDAIEEKQSTQDVLVAELAVDPDKGIKTEKKKLEEKLKDISNNIEKLSRALIPAEKLPAVLQSILEKNESLTLVSLQMLPLSELNPRPAPATSGITAKTTNAKPAIPEKSARTVYKHGVVVTVEGEFFSTVEYLRKIESLDWEIFWEKIRYEVKNYPLARVSLEVYTLSTDDMENKA